MRPKQLFLLLVTVIINSHALRAVGPVTKVDPVPDVPEALPIGSVPMGNLEDFPEYQLDLDMTDGPFKANWESIEANYPGSPEWLRDAKFGIWVH
ncbi:MAG: alpha-L-fucosidase, partial [Muribaculaceae bacterium]|nr:alpha-L-fucosidase [Muribaculaceae bacterium]